MLCSGNCSCIRLAVRAIGYERADVLLLTGRQQSRLTMKATDLEVTQKMGMVILLFEGLKQQDDQACCPSNG